MTWHNGKKNILSSNHIFSHFNPHIVVLFWYYTTASHFINNFFTVDGKHNTQNINIDISRILGLVKQSLCPHLWNYWHIRSGWHIQMQHKLRKTFFFIVCSKDPGKGSKGLRPLAYSHTQLRMDQMCVTVPRSTQVHFHKQCTHADVLTVTTFFCSLQVNPFFSTRH